VTSSSIGVAVIGAGKAGRAHAACYRSAATLYDAGLPEVRLVAIADVNAAFAADHRPALRLPAGGAHRRHPGPGRARRHRPAPALQRPLLVRLRLRPARADELAVQGRPGSGAFSDIGSHLLDLAEFVCGPIRSVRGAVLQTVIAERPLPLGTAVGHAAVEVGDQREPVENEDLVTLTATFTSGRPGRCRPPGSPTAWRTRSASSCSRSRARSPATRQGPGSSASSTAPPTA
jgi:predicted dehydrogenase